jgi:hypothetical protein
MPLTEQTLEPKNCSTKKIFIIGLPRTATTSVCVAMLTLGFKTAHTAYTFEALENAEVIADTPVFCDYPQLADKYPQANFIYLSRQAELWLPSIRQLLSRMFVNLQRDDGGFNPTIKRCYNQVFSPLTHENINDDDFLINCYQNHYNNAVTFFEGRKQALLVIDVKAEDSYTRMCDFLSLDEHQRQGSFEPINIAGKVTAWNKIRHDLKVSSTRKGKIDKMD